MTVYQDRFAGKIVLVTGGVSGIGGATSERLLAEGATVIAADISERQAESFAAEHAETGRLHTLALDVTDPEAVTAAVDGIVDEHGRLDVVVNNAGIGGGGAVGDVSDADWRAVLAVDLDGVFHVARASLRHLEASGGTIVNTASISGLGGDRTMAAYNAAKGGVVNLTRSMAIDYGRRGVRINAVAPGPVATPLLQPVLDASPAVRESYAERIPLARVAESPEIAAAILYLASDDASYVNGVVLPVDGGLTAATSQPDIAAHL